MNIEPNMKPGISPRLRLILKVSIFGLFLTMLASLFVFNLVDFPKKTFVGSNLIKNSSFEQWEKGAPVQWVKDESFLFDEPTSKIHGEHAVGIYSRDSVRKGIVQTIDLDPNETYNVYFSLKSARPFPENVGVEIRYIGNDVKTTIDVSPGIHYYDGNNSWRQYFGRISGAESITLFFFAQNDNILYVDACGVGINLPLYSTKQKAPASVQASY